jgi:hypothetical protein
MSKEIKENIDRTAAGDCEHQEELVAYLYGESSDAEKASFERHLHGCGSCRSDLAAFGRVRDELSAWQVGFAPRTEIVLQPKGIGLLREIIGMFPMWVRGAALAGAAAALLIVALSVAGAGISLKDGDLAVSFGGRQQTETARDALSSDEIEKLVQNAVSKEREKMQRAYEVQLAGLKAQLDAEHKEILQATSVRQKAQLDAVRADLKQEIQTAGRQNSSIRSFFAMDEASDPWIDVR